MPRKTGITPTYTPSIEKVQRLCAVKSGVAVATSILWLKGRPAAVKRTISYGSPSVQGYGMRTRAVARRGMVGEGSTVNSQEARLSQPTWTWESVTSLGPTLRTWATI